MKDDITLNYEAETGTTKQQTAVRKIDPLIAAYRQSSGAADQDPDTLLTDLLADLHHWADACGVDFEAAANRAEMHHSFESDDNEDD